MKALLFLMASILLLNTTYGETEDSIFVIISGDTVQIWNTQAYENCGCLFKMDVLVSNDTIYVTEVDTTSDWAFCMCYFDMCASLTGLQSGKYIVNVFRYMPLFHPDTVFYIGSISFTYGGSMLAFNSQTYLSECYNITEVSEVENFPTEYTLNQNYPNPFNPITTIKYGMPERSFVELRVYDILGREVELLVNEEQDAEYYEIDFNAAKLTSGIYLYQLKTGSFVEFKKMILLK